MQTSYLRGVPFCLVATVSWGCMFPVMTSALTQMDPFNFTAIRYTIAAIPFAVLLLAREGKGAFNLKGERIFAPGSSARPVLPALISYSRAPDPGDLSRGAIHRLASEMCLINKEETVYA